MAIRIRAAKRRAGRAQRRARRGPGTLAPDRELPAGRLAPLPLLPPTRRADQGARRVAIALLATLLLHGAPLLLLLQRATAQEVPLEVTLVARPSPPVLPGAPTVPTPLPPFREALRARSLPRLGRLPVLPTRDELIRSNVRPVPARRLVADALAPRPALLVPAPLRGPPLRPATVAPEPVGSGATEAKLPREKKPEAKLPEPPPGAKLPEPAPGAKLPEPVKPEATPPEPVKPEAKPPEPVKPEAKPPEPVKPEAKPPPVKPEAKPPEPVKPEAKLPEPPPAPPPEPRLVIRDPDDPSPPPVPLLTTAPAAPDATRRLVDAIAAAAHQTADGAPASAPDALAIDPLLAALRPGPEEPGSSELAGARSGDSAGLGTAPEPGGGALPGPADGGDGASGRASPGGLVATDPGGIPVPTPVSARAGEPGSAPGNGGSSGPAGAGGPASGSPGPLARKGVADGAPDGTRTYGRPGRGRAFEGDFEELDETEEVHVRAWVRQLKRAIAGQWNTPPGMDRQAVRGKTAEVEFAIRRDGKLLLVRLSSSTGEPALDQAVLEAFRRAIIPAFPEELPGESRGWRASFKY